MSVALAVVPAMLLLGAAAPSASADTTATASAATATASAAVTTPPGLNSVGPNSGQGAFEYNYVTEAECKADSTSTAAKRAATVTSYTKNPFAWCVEAKDVELVETDGQPTGNPEKYWDHSDVTVLGKGHTNGRGFQLQFIVDNFRSCGSSGPVHLTQAEACSYIRTQGLGVGVTASYTPTGLAKCGPVNDASSNAPYGFNRQEDGWINNHSAVLNFSMKGPTTGGNEDISRCHVTPLITVRDDRAPEDDVTYTVNGAKTLNLNANTVRCDDAPYIASTYGAGCVFTNQAPVLHVVKGSDIDADARHIADAQGNKEQPTSGDHVLEPGARAFNIPGSPSSGLPLHRLYPAPARNNALIADVCNAWWPGYAKKATPEDCDEYPFNSTEERGSSDTILPGEYSVRAINRTQNRRAGGFLNSFYKQDRVLNGEAFYVKVNT